jgi:serine/threonine protein kinase
MHYLLFYDVVPDYADRRAPFRAAHLAHARAALGRGELLLGGALAAPIDGAVLLFRTMRFVNGRQLKEAIRAYHAKRRAGAPVALDLLGLLNAFVTVCQAVAYAHSQGFLHCDLKGSNVILGDFGEVVLLDWGLAREMSAPPDAEPPEPDASSGSDSEALAWDRTLPGRVKGTAEYMAPEQAEGQTARIGPHTDVYGLGAMLYEILVGRPPFVGTEAVEVLAQVVNAAPVPPRDLVADVPPPLEAGCLRALAKEPGDRHGSAAELAAEVQGWLAEAANRSRVRQERERFFNLSLDVLCTIGPDERFNQFNPAWDRSW